MQPKVIAALLAIFLGTLGIHKFYLKDNKGGAIYLGVGVLGSMLTFGIAGLVIWVMSVIDAIKYLQMSDDEFAQTYGIS